MIMEWLGMTSTPPRETDVKCKIIFLFVFHWNEIHFFHAPVSTYSFYHAGWENLLPHLLLSWVKSCCFVLLSSNKRAKQCLFVLRLLKINTYIKTTFILVTRWIFWILITRRLTFAGYYKEKLNVDH